MQRDLLQGALMRSSDFLVECLHASLSGGCTLLPALNVLPQDLKLLASASHLHIHSVLGEAPL